MRAKTPRGRLRQVERWLAANYPCDRPVEVRVAGVEPHGAETSRIGQRYRILLGRDSLKVWGFDMVEVLIHEWAHARVWRTSREGDVDTYHDAEWALEYGALYRAFYDAGGEDDSCEFRASPWR